LREIHLVNIEHLYKLHIGGTVDTLALSAIGSSFFFSSVSMASAPKIIPFSLTMVGGLHLFWRATEHWRNRFAMQSSLEISSAHSPSEPKTSGGLQIGFSSDKGEPIFIDDEHLMRHLFIIGQSGVGKTVAASMMLFQQIQRGGGVLFIDGKLDAENIKQIYHFCCWNGRQQDFLVINPGDPSNSNTYNPILFGDPDEVASRILALIPSTENSPGADHYKQEANQGLSTLISALQKAGLSYNMIDLSVLLLSSGALTELEQKLASKAPGSEELRNYALFLDKFRITDAKNPNMGQIDASKLKTTFGGVGGRLYMFGTGKFGKVMNTYDPDVNLFEAIRSNKIIYVALPTMGKSEAAQNFGRMVVGDLRTAVSWLQALPEVERPDPPFLSFFDEAGSYVNANWSRMFEQARSAHMILMPAAQTVANFQAISDELFEMVVGNAWTKLTFKVGTQATALEAAELIGMKMGVVKGLSGSVSDSQSADFLRSAPESGVGQSSGIGESEREQEVYRVTPDQLKELEKGECVMTFGAADLFVLRIPKIDVTSHMKKKFGEMKVNRFRASGWANGAFFGRDSERFLSAMSHAAPNKKGKPMMSGKGNSSGAIGKEVEIGSLEEY
jgi:intracellular multiplication protein IcmO